MTDDDPMKEEKMVFENVYTGGQGPKGSERRTLANRLFLVLREFEERTGERIGDIEVESDDDEVVGVHVTISSYYEKKGDQNDD